MTKRYFIMILLSLSLISMLYGCNKKAELSHIETEEPKTLPLNPKDSTTVKSLNISKSIEEFLAKNHKKLIKEQSFPIALEEFGDVSFLSCAPDYTYDDADLDSVIFCLAKEEILLQFPPTADDSSIYAFEDISFVSFEDIYQDGSTDIIIGVNYITGTGPTGMIPFTQVRIYHMEGKEAVYNEDLSNKINNDRPGETLESVLDYIKQIK